MEQLTERKYWRAGERTAGNSLGAVSKSIPYFKTVLLDLDGTLTDTAHAQFKARKDGKETTDPATIPVLKGAPEFVQWLLDRGMNPIVVSDSHPRYVGPLVKHHFHNIPCLSLSDKPNLKKVKSFLEEWHLLKNVAADSIMIGDSWLDIEMARGLGCASLLARLYSASAVEQRDGIGQPFKNLKSGPTFVADSYEQMRAILKDPLNHLAALEAVMAGGHSCIAYRHDRDKKDATGFVAFRSLARQEAGDGDAFSVATEYQQFQQEQRSPELLHKMAHAVSRYVNHVVQSKPDLIWDVISFMPDKSTSRPANKMKQFFELLDTPLPKQALLQWPDALVGCIRDRKTRSERGHFVKEQLQLCSHADVAGTNMIIIDDQYTTGATAASVCNLLRENGARSILFIALCYLTSSVALGKTCPICGKPLMIKIRKRDGKRFYSCTPPRFRGDGCGHTEDLP